MDTDEFRDSLDKMNNYNKINLHECSNHTKLRDAFWPTGTPLRTKLYGRQQDLERTTRFLLAAGLPVWQHEQQEDKPRI